MPRAEAAPRLLGLGGATALVVGNMIGSGAFLLPASLAPYGAASLLGWGVSAGGAVLLALVFARLAALHPRSGVAVKGGQSAPRLPAKATAMAALAHQIATQ